jgi:hypothetical protein
MVHSDKRGSRIRSNIRIGIIAGVLVCLTFWLGPCRKLKEAKRAAPPVALKETEKAKVEIDTSKREVRYAVRKPDGTIETKAVREVRHATVIVKTDGEIQVIARPYGFCFEPGLGFAYNAGFYPTADVQFFFYQRWGTSAGLYYKDNLRLYLACNYSLSGIHLGNANLWLGIDLKQDIVFGVQVRL